MALSEQAKLQIALEAKNNAGAAFGQLHGQLGSLVSAAKAAAIALAGAFAFKEILSATMRWGEELDLLRDTLGVTGEEASRLNYITRTVGIDTETAAQAFAILSKRIGTSMQDIQSGTSVFDKFGIKVLDSQGNVKDFTTLLGDMNAAFVKMPDGLAKTDAELELFGRGGKKIHDLLSLNTKQIAALSKEAKDLGLVMSTQTVDSMEEFARLTRRAGMALDAMKITIGKALLPVLTEALMLFLRFVIEVWPRFVNWMQPVLSGLRDLGAATFNLFMAMGRVLSAVISTANAGQRLAGVTKVIGEAFRVVVGIIKEVTNRLDKFASDISEHGIIGALHTLMDDILEMFGKKLTSLGIDFDALSKAVSDAGAALKAASTGDFADAKANFKAFADDLKNAFSNIVIPGGNPLETFTSSFTAALTTLGVVMGVANLSKIIVQPLIFVGSRVAAVLGGWPVLISAAIIAGIVTLATHWDEVVAFFDEHIKPLWDHITEQFKTNAPKVWDAVVTVFHAGVETVENFLSTAPGRFADWIGQSIPIWLNNAGQLFLNFTTWIMNVGLPNTISWIESNVPKFGEWIINSVPVWLANIGTLFGNLLEWIIGTGLPSLVDVLVNKVAPAAWMWITQIIPTVLLKLGEWMAAVIGWIGLTLLPALVKGLFDAGVAMIGGIVRGLGDLVEKVKPVFTTFMSNVATWLSTNIPFVGGVFAAVQWIIDRLNDAIRLWQSLPSWLGGGNTSVPPPHVPQEGEPGYSGPQYAEGGVVMARPGGTQVTVGEGGQDEAIIPLNRAGINTGMGGGTTVINIDVHDNVATSEDELGRRVAQAIVRNAQLRRNFSF